MNLKPWEIHPALTTARLEAIGRLLWKERDSAARDARWERGDDLWTIGCTAFKRSLTAISKSAGGLDGYEELSWLTIRDGSMHFRFGIGGVPIRFFRGDAGGDVPRRYAVPDDTEVREHQTAFELFDTPTPTGIFRMQVQTDGRGSPLGVRLVQVASDGRVLNSYRINAKPGDSGDGDATTLHHSPVTPPPASVRTAAEAAALEKPADASEKKGA